MVKAWYVNEISGNERELIREINLDELSKATNVIYYKIDPNDYRKKVDEIKIKYQFKHEDIVDLGPEYLEDFEVREKKFGTEHLHLDEEVRFALTGQGYFEVRDINDNWIRIHVEGGDFLILPAKIYHRFFFHKTNSGQYVSIKFLRLFKDNSPYYMAFRNSS